MIDMSINAELSSEARWRRRLESAESLADDLGSLGAWVGPRNGPNKRTHGQKEDYVLRRLLVAWNIEDKLRFPVDIFAETDRPKQPDFVLAWSPGETLGIEVTEAGEEDYQAWLTHTEGPHEESAEAVDLPDEISTLNTAEQIRNAIDKKVKKFKAGSYCDPTTCDLVVYDNSAWGWFEDKRQLLGALGHPGELLGRFRQIHIVFGETIYLDVFGNDRTAVDISKTYEIDYARWISDQIDLMRQNATSELDLARIAEELEDLGKRERRSLSSHLRNLMYHFLKWQYQPDMRTGSWTTSIENARLEIIDLLADSPSLGREVESRILKQYDRARRLAMTDTKLPLAHFPETCPYTMSELLDDEYLPDEGL